MAYAGHAWFKTRGALEPLPAPPAWAGAITRRREALGLSKTDLARAANVGRATVWSAEQGLETVTERTLERIGEALDSLEAAAAGRSR